MGDPFFHGEVVCEYIPEIAAGIGRLMPDLDDRKADNPISEERVRTLIELPDTDAFVVYKDAAIVGAAILYKLVGFTGDRAILQDFVTSQEVRGQGTGYALWQELLQWCRQRGIERLVCMSSPHRTEARAFYERQGAKQIDKNVFEFEIPKES